MELAITCQGEKLRIKEIVKYFGIDERYQVAVVTDSCVM